MKSTTIIFSAALLLFLQAIGFSQTSYTAISSGNWNDPLIWSPQGVPGPGDIVSIGQKTVSTNGAKEVSDFSILIGGELIVTSINDSLTITGNASWGGGIFRGNGVITIANGAIMLIDDPQWTSGLYGGATLLNLGTVRMTVNSGIWGRDFSVIDNRGLFEIDTENGNFGGFPNGGVFINTGTFRKVSGNNACNFNANWQFQNLGGTIDVQSGALTFNCDGLYNGGTYDVAAGGLLHFDSGNNVFEGTLTGTPAGVIELSVGVTADFGASGATFDFQGTGFNWSGGTFTGGNSTLILNTGLMVLTDSQWFSELRGGITLRNQGTIRQEVNPGLTAQDASILDNQGIFEIDTENGSFSGSGGGGIFMNSGIFRKISGTGVSSVGSTWDFQNQAGGVINATSGEIDFVNLENAPGAIIQGVAAVDVPNNFTNNGITAPGASPGSLSYLGDYQPSSTGVLDIELGGLNPGSDYDQLAVTGNATLNGALDLSLINSFVPQAGDSFVVLTTTGSISDSFTTVNVPSGLFVDVQINSNNVTVVVDSVGLVGIDDHQTDTEIISEYNLFQNYPNPFNPATTIRYAIVKSTNVQVVIYDMLGRAVKTLVNKNMAAGTHAVQWNGTNNAGAQVSSGIYIYRLKAGEFSQTRRMILMR